MRRLLAIAGTIIVYQLAPCLHGQTLSLSSATVSGPGAVVLNLNFNPAGASVSSLQWTLQYPPAISLPSAVAGAALTAAGKSLSCAAGSGTYTCVAYGINTTAIGSGVVAAISLTAAQTASIAVSNALSVNPNGTFQSMTATGGTITVQAATPVFSSLSCSPAVITGPGSSTCTVTLSGAATAATAVSLKSSDSGVVVAGSVTIAKGATSGQFTATNSSALTGSVTITATLGSASKTATLTYTAAAPVLSSLSCSPAVITGPGSSTCTVTLSGAATAATAVSLKSSDSAVVVPQTATVSMGSSSAQFSAVNSSSLSDTVTITATLGSASKTATLALNSTTVSMRINAGGSAYTDAEGNAWSGDKGYSGGITCAVSNTIANTNSPTLYQTCRWGVFGYTLNVPNGNYNVTLKFAEVAHASAGQRLFNVAINGTSVLRNFDIFAQAGGEFIAIDKTFPVSVSGGQVAIQFTQGAALYPMVSAIDVEPSSLPSPIRLNSGGPSYTDPAGNVWAADNGYSGGSTCSLTNPIANTNTAALYQTCRWGTFSYTTDVPDGDYYVTLKFAEVAYSRAGARQFNVAINGAQVLENFDIYAQAGGELVALDKSFPVVVRGGQVAIQFTRGAADYPMVNAISITTATLPPAVRINSGGSTYLDPVGNVWTADADFNGGSTWTVTNPISNTTTPGLYQSCRWGAFTYTADVPDGNYNVILKFAEVSRFSARAREFNVAIQGRTVLTNFDIFAQSGGAFIALDKSYAVTVTNGKIVIQFTYGGADAPMVNGIDIEPAP